MKVEDLNLYFDEDDNAFFIKSEYTCIWGGFVDHYITIITMMGDGSYVLSTPDDDYTYSGDWSDIDVYELTKVT